MDTKRWYDTARQKGVHMASHKRYSDEFKYEAIKLVTEQHLSRTQVARDLGIAIQTLRRWLRELTLEQPTAARSVSEQAERARLRRENELLRMERDILKKAIGICEQMPQ
jgi:transposase